MAQYTSIEPIELTDDELQAVGGGWSIGGFQVGGVNIYSGYNTTNSGNLSGNVNATNSFNNSGNTTVSNSFND